MIRYDQSRMSTGHSTRNLDVRQGKVSAPFRRGEGRQDMSRLMASDLILIWPDMQNICKILQNQNTTEIGLKKKWEHHGTSSSDTFITGQDHPCSFAPPKLSSIHVPQRVAKVSPLPSLVKKFNNCIFGSRAFTNSSCYWMLFNKPHCKSLLNSNPKQGA